MWQGKGQKEVVEAGEWAGAILLTVGKLLS